MLQMISPTTSLSVVQGLWITPIHEPTSLNFLECLEEYTSSVSMWSISKMWRLDSVAVASSEESPVAMKLKKMWLKAPVSEDGDTNLGKRIFSTSFRTSLVIVNLLLCILFLIRKKLVILVQSW
jgi:hypothetical protein